MHSAIAALAAAATLSAAPAVPARSPSNPRAPQATASPDTQAITAKMDAVIDKALQEQRIVGTVVVVVKDGQVIYRRAAGYSDREARTPMREDAVFRLASMTKPLVSTTALALVDQGKLSLEDPVTRYLPTFRPRLADGREPIITVRHLLTHSSGLMYGFQHAPGEGYPKAGISDGLDNPQGLTLEENLRRLSSVPLAFEPGARWHYSLSTDVLGAVVARAGGAALPQVVEKLVTQPLKMKDTGFSVKDASRLAVPYSDGKPAPVRMGQAHGVPFGEGVVQFAPDRVLNPSAFPSGGAGMVGTADDFARFLEALRQGGAPVLKKSTAQQLGVVQRGPEAQTQGPGWGWGLLSAVLVDPAPTHSPQSAGTWQWGGAYGHNWFVDAKKNLTVVAMTNTAFEGMNGPFTFEVRDAAYASEAPVTGVKLHPLDCGSAEFKDLSPFTDTGELDGESGTLSAPCFLIRHPRGNLLWDAGLGDHLAQEPNGHEQRPGVRFVVKKTLASQLEQLGLKASDVQFVAFSHLHVDHTGNARNFQSSTWLVHRDEWNWSLQKPTPPGVDASALAGHPKQKTVLLNADHDVFGDGSVRILKTPGHTPGHQVLLVRLPKTGNVMLSGDLFHTRENFEKGLMPSFNFNRADTLASIDRVYKMLKNTNGQIIIQHDAKEMAKLPAFPQAME
ncbi:beta-lactamase [Myxococcus stipitatus DSM 14675]|uniref:Beta-lactamase n=1 Tax=Myxococcus stipitatus (strain DSM 14675 / JCM 12634 / Mx s8) TaxID=1278073 RepID=L7UIC4_MYXSD|nr:serine hydrolase [Myxococcus stipitatus]AGC48716.1 beta-lactamase [Myxococcus stipitatus DSM 14675]